MITDPVTNEQIPEPIHYPLCPINMYFEGDEDKCDVSKCDFDIEFRCCTEACKLNIGGILANPIEECDGKCNSDSPRGYAGSNCDC